MSLFCNKSKILFPLISHQFEMTNSIMLQPSKGSELNLSIDISIDEIELSLLVNDEVEISIAKNLSEVEEEDEQQKSALQIEQGNKDVAGDLIERVDEPQNITPALSGDMTEDPEVDDIGTNEEVAIKEERATILESINVEETQERTEKYKPQNQTTFVGQNSAEVIEDTPDTYTSENEEMEDLNLSDDDEDLNEVESDTESDTTEENAPDQCKEYEVNDATYIGQSKYIEPKYNIKVVFKFVIMSCFLSVFTE